MNKWIAAYLATALTMLVLDALWLGVLATDFYRSGIGHLMMDKPDFAAAAVFYVLYVTGIIVFVVAPAPDGSTRTHAAWRGGLFGFFCYMTYDLTNMATLKGWPLQLVMVDILWGMFITAASALAGHLAAKAAAKSTT